VVPWIELEADLSELATEVGVHVLAAQAATAEKARLA